MAVKSKKKRKKTNANFFTPASYRRRIAESRAGRAYNNLGMMYENGKGVSKVLLEAIRLYRIAAGKGNAYAQFKLGVMYSAGTGVPFECIGLRKENIPLEASESLNESSIPFHVRKVF